jgi:hypothetical protein
MLNFMLGVTNKPLMLRVVSPRLDLKAAKVSTCGLYYKSFMIIDYDP